MTYSPIEPFDHGTLDVGQGNDVYWEVCGSPAGKPALVLHGGPGSGCSPFYRRLFDPQAYRIVLLDQRGCGRSTPHASDPATDLSVNTTAHLLRDLEVLRAFLKIERWLVFGVSWGCTLALAYAEQHPERVSSVVMSGVTMTRRSEISWLYRDIAPLLPAQWDRFRQGVPPEQRDGDLIEAYFHLLNHADPAVRARAARDWHSWEAASVSVDPDAENPPISVDQRFELARARIVTHYFRHAAWLEEGILLKNADKISAISGVMVHGRLDLAAPLVTPWELSKVWQNGKLVILPSAGHSLRDAGITDAIIRATDQFAKIADR